jgi:uncharacterized protein DUF6174
MSILLERPVALAAISLTMLACGRRSQDSTPAVTVAAAVAQACRDVDPGRMADASAPPPRDGYTPLATRDSLLRQIDAGEQKWRASRPAAYRMTVVASCFCRDRGLPVVLSVVADSVVASRDTTGQQSWPDDWRIGLHVAGLFKEARQFACDSTRTTNVTLDRTLGYPTVLSTASRLEVSDSEREYRVLSFASDSAR